MVRRWRRRPEELTRTETKRQSFSEVIKAEVEVENSLEDRVKTQSRRLSGIHPAVPIQMKWKQDCEVV